MRGRQKHAEAVAVDIGIGGISKHSVAECCVDFLRCQFRVVEIENHAMIRPFDHIGIRVLLGWVLCEIEQARREQVVLVLFAEGFAHLVPESADEFGFKAGLDQALHVLDLKFLVWPLDGVACLVPCRCRSGVPSGEIGCETCCFFGSRCGKFWFRLLIETCRIVLCSNTGTARENT